MVATAYGSADKLPLAGGTLTGTLVLAGAPAMQAAVGGAIGAVWASDAFGNAGWSKTGVDWFNARAYGAIGDGSHDDTAAINGALAAANAQGGGTVLLPWTAGGYLTSAPIVPPPGVTLAGETCVSLPYTPSTVPAMSRIVASAAWAPGSSTGIVEFRSLTPGGWSQNTFHSGLRNLMIDGHLNASANLNAIRFVGPIFDCHLEDVLLYKAPHNGIISSSQAESGIGPTQPWHHRYRRVTAYYCGNRGFDLTNATDSTYEDCLAFGNTSHGWLFQNTANSLLVGCRAEWNGGSGFEVTGGGTGMVLSGCSTDNNTQRGIFLTSVTDTGGGAVSVTGYKGHCDGHDGASAGIEIASCAVPVVVTGALVEADALSGTTYPTAGVKVTGSSNIIIADSVIGGQSASLVNGGTNTSLMIGHVIERVGNAGSSADCPSEMVIVKPSDQTTTANIVHVNDTALLTPTLPPNSTWEVFSVVIYDDSTAGDFDVQWSCPSGATFPWASLSGGLGASSPATMTGTVQTAGVTTFGIGAVGAGTPTPWTSAGILTVTTAGALQLKWSQHTSDPATLTVRAGSFLKLKRIG